jgi:hypothetical protein
MKITKRSWFCSPAQAKLKKKLLSIKTLGVVTALRKTTLRITTISRTKQQSA